MSEPNTAEYLRLEAAALGPNPRELDAQQEELLRQLEFVVLMKSLWGTDGPQTP